jgi:pyrroline-5-carboxylate reductase
MTTISFLGTGRMATALIGSIIKSGTKVSIIASDKSEENLRNAKKMFGIKTTNENKEAVRNSDIVFLCVKPQDMGTLLAEIKGSISGQLVVSIVSGIKISYIEKSLKTKKVVKVVPNLNCMVGEMAAGFSVGRGVGKQDAEIILDILNSAGAAFKLEEKLLDTVVSVSGSGVAFFAYFIDAVAQEAMKEGMEKETAYRMVSQVALGTSKLFLEKNLSTDDILTMVTSKKGTTVAGFKVLKKHKAKDILMRAVSAATKRSAELGK